MQVCARVPNERPSLWAGTVGCTIAVVHLDGAAPGQLTMVATGEVNRDQAVHQGTVTMLCEAFVTAAAAPVLLSGDAAGNIGVRAPSAVSPLLCPFALFLCTLLALPWPCAPPFLCPRCVVSLRACHLPARCFACHARLALGRRRRQHRRARPLCCVLVAFFFRAPVLFRHCALLACRVRAAPPSQRRPLIRSNALLACRGRAAPRLLCPLFVLFPGAPVMRLRPADSAAVQHSGRVGLTPCE